MQIINIETITNVIVFRLSLLNQIISIMKAKEYLKANPEKYVLVTREFGYPIYITSDGSATATDKKEDGLWDSLSNTETRLNYFTSLTGYKGLAWERN